ncbi:MAG: 3-hydroxyacyl-ACP dehydratase [Bacteroidota bacterium]
MLQGNFYDIQSFSVSDQVSFPLEFTATILLNAGHPIYQGHFPGNPVVPGVCQLQMVTELAGKAVHRKLVLAESDNIKFLSLINPDLNRELEFRILIKQVESGRLSVTASIIAGSTVFLKFKGKFDTEK